MDVEGNVVSQLDASLLIVDFGKLARFCGLGDKLSGFTKTRRAGDDFFGTTPPRLIELLSAWAEKLGPSFWKSPDVDHWFNVTFQDPDNENALDELNTSSYKPWHHKLSMLDVRYVRCALARSPLPVPSSNPGLRAQFYNYNNSCTAPRIGAQFYGAQNQAPSFTAPSFRRPGSERALDPARACGLHQAPHGARAHGKARARCALSCSFRWCGRAAAPTPGGAGATGFLKALAS